MKFKKGDYVICPGDVLKKVYRRDHNIKFNLDEYEAIVIDENHYDRVLLKLITIDYTARVESKDIYPDFKKIRDIKLKIIMEL